MPADASMLEAMGKKTGCELVYFEKVDLLDPRHKEAIYLCVGKAAIWFINTSLSGLARNPVSQISYEWLDKVVQDTMTTTDIMLVLNDGRPSDCPEQLSLVSECRSELLTKLAVCFLAEGMLRLGKLVTFPRFEDELRVRSGTIKRVVPFAGYKTVSCKGYQMFLRKEFTEKHTATKWTETGMYEAPPKVFSPSGTSSATSADDEEKIEVELHIYDPVPILDLTKVGWDHIRWVALEYKQALIKDMSTYVSRNQHYLKKMNLTNDPAAWTGWELMIKGKEHVTMVILLRRQYVPPLMDTAQDCAIVFRCPCKPLDAGRVREEDFVHACHLAADTFSCAAQNMILYPEVIQAKLDALLFDEDGFSWIKSRLRMQPRGKTDIYKYAYVFIQGILKILSDENVLAHLSLKGIVRDIVAELCGRDKRAQDLEPLEISRLLLDEGESIPKEANGIVNGSNGEASASDKNLLASKYAWHMRVAKFFAYCLDGGLLGAKFTLTDLVSCLAADQVTTEAENKLSEIVAFLLHVRPRDMTLPWPNKPLRRTLMSESLLESVFNDRVMQVLLELGYIRKLFKADKKEVSGTSENASEYAKFLTVLLKCESSSVSLKASICRQIISFDAHHYDHAIMLCVGLMHVMVTGGTFLATYACAALVNLSQAKDAVKNFVMSENVAQICADQLRTNDDDLVLYSLMLLVHLTKSIRHRAAVKATGCIPLLYDMLRTNAEKDPARLNLPAKGKIVTEICSVLGQMCNDEATRAEVCENFQAIECLLVSFDRSKDKMKIQSKVIFALKQLCVNSDDNKDQVGARVIKPIVEDLRNKDKPANKDWGCNAVMFLLLLSIRRPNCQLIHENRWDSTYKVLSESPLGRLDVTRDKIAQLNSRVAEYNDPKNVLSAR